MKTILAIDLGGSSAKVSLIRQDGKIVKRFENIDTLKGEKIIDNIKNEIFKQDPNIIFDAIGFATAGMLDINKGIIIIAGNLGLRNFPLSKKIEEQFQKPCYIINDANAAALGENWVGAGHNAHSLILYTIGTGVGGGIIINDMIITGMNGTAGELGHGGNFQDNIKCNCGLDNCMEPVSSALALKRNLGKLKKPIELRNITNEILKKNKEVRSVFSNTWEHLTDHMSIMIYALNPHSLIIGGGVSNIGPEIKKIILEHLEKKVHPDILNGLHVNLATLGNDAGIFGAARNALQHLKV